MISVPYILNLLVLAGFFTYGMYLYFLEKRGVIQNKNLVENGLRVSLICIAGYFWYTFGQWQAAKVLFEMYHMPDQVLKWKLINEYGNAVCTLLMCLKVAGCQFKFKKKP